MPATKINRRELVTLAKPIDNAKRPKIGGWLASEKLDGTRCLWDGGLTRGMPTASVPWAGVLNPKTLKPKDKIKPISTGLWSRYGNPIMAPDWFLDSLPKLVLDGELWAGRGQFQTCRSIVAGDCGDDRWRQIEYKIYGAPSLEVLTQPGLMKSATYYCEMSDTALQDMLARICEQDLAIGWACPDTPFDEALTMLNEMLGDNDVCEVLLQRCLPPDEVLAWGLVEEQMESVLALGGEGLILRNPKANYEVKRTANLLKFKNVTDDEGTLVGFTEGKGKYTGMIGALILDYHGKRLELSGMTDAERELPSKVFTVGDTIEFAYRELSDDGIPKEARYMRVKRGTNE